MKSRSDTDLAKPPALSGVREVPRRGEVKLEPESTAKESKEPPFERSIASGRSSSFSITDLALHVVSSGKLSWRTL
ncbi:MAG: hypothetical protein M3Z16_05755, partial [Pseudomonadota bacterium]|nr:hypothetical protein [Pseudomonadota bacterium]